jgi:uncharacterized protein YbjT (DUF2867 family)
MSQPSTTTPRTLITGASGKTGRRVAERAEAAGLPVRRVSRSTDPHFDWEQPATWSAVLAEIDQVYVAYAPDLAVPGAVDTVRAFAAAAREVGVRRIVLLSGRGEEAAEAAERVVQASGLEFTILRCSWFMQNFSEDFLRDAVLEGALALPVGDVREPFVDADDIADVAAAALTTDAHVGELYELTGRTALSFADAAALIAVETGRPLVHVPVPMADYLAALEELGMPDEVRGLVGYLFSEVLDGRNAAALGDVERALGRPAGTFEAYAARAQANGAWVLTAPAEAVR